MILDLMHNAHLKSFKLNLQQVDKFKSISQHLRIFTTQQGVKDFEIKMTKSTANLNDLLLFVSQLNFEDITVKFNTIQASQAIAAVLFGQRTLVRRLSTGNESEEEE